MSWRSRRFRGALLGAIVVMALVAGLPTALGVFSSARLVSANAFSSDTLSPPTNLVATGGCPIGLSWTATPKTYASGHRLLRGTASGGPYAQIAQVTPRTQTTYSDAVKAGTYYYVARAYFQNWESVNSGQSSATSTCAIGHDASTSCTPTSANSFTWSHTTAGVRRILIVGVAIRNDSGQTVTGVTYGATALTQIGAATSGTSVRTELWRLVAPATGANDVVVTLSATAKASCGASSLTGVDQSSPIDDSNFGTGTSTSPSTSVSASDGGWVVDALAFRAVNGPSGKPSATPGSGQTERWSGYTETAGWQTNIRGKGSTEGPRSPAGSVVMDWSLDSSVDWAIGAVALNRYGD